MGSMTITHKRCRIPAAEHGLPGYYFCWDCACVHERDRWAQSIPDFLCWLVAQCQASAHLSLFKHQYSGWMPYPERSKLCRLPHTHLDEPLGFGARSNLGTKAAITNQTFVWCRQWYLQKAPDYFSTWLAKSLLLATIWDLHSKHPIPQPEEWILQTCRPKGSCQREQGDFKHMLKTAFQMPLFLRN